jgi:hypothetical protein
MLILLLTVALMIIFTAMILPSIEYQIKHDREQELIHRGVQYSRAIRAYYKKFGRYPMKMEDLESANNLRFLRKRYKDPTNCSAGKCEEFRLLHFGEVKLTMGGAMLPTQVNPVGSPGAVSSLGANAQAMGNLAVAGAVAQGMSSGFPQNQFGQAPAGTDPSQAAASGTTDQNAANGGQGGSDNGDAQPNLNGFANQTFGGGPIVGVASNTKCPPHPKDDCEGYREFNHKKKYKDWQFIYDPGTDRGGLLMTPNQPPLFPQQNNLNGQNASGATGANPAGQNNQNSFGNNAAQPGSDNSGNTSDPQQNDTPVLK